MARIRTFIAVELDPTLRERCVQLQHKLSDTGCAVKWVPRNNIHITLLFLGEVIDREIPRICQAVSGVANEFSGFAISLQGVGCFPNPRRPRVLWTGVGLGHRELTQLHDALEPPLLDLGCYRREDRQYTPHITLGRVEGDGDAGEIAQAISGYQRWQGGEMEVRQIRVMSSELTREGPIYTVLGTVPFRGKSASARSPQADDRVIGTEDEELS